MSVTTYVIDAEDRIVSVSEGWDAFAMANDGPAACASHVVGQPLFSSIDGDPVRMFMTAILMRVRVSGQPEDVPYRCDSDRVRRLYRMRLEPLADKAVRVIHALEDSQKAEQPVAIRLAHAGGPATPRCSICNKVKEAGVWVDPFDGGRAREIRVVHTVCPECRAAGGLRRVATARERKIFGAELLKRKEMRGANI